MSSSEDIAIVGLLENFLGAPKSSKDFDTRTQWEFNCPTSECNLDRDKFNLVYNSEKKVFKCWKCKYKGYVHKLFKDYADKEVLKRAKLILPKSDFSHKKTADLPKGDYNDITCQLPGNYMPLSVFRNSSLYKLALEYICNERKLSMADIDKFKIGYTEGGDFGFKIIMPSLNERGAVNYFQARSYMPKSKIKYQNPKTPSRTDIIFNSYFINWDLPVYLVEGVFDSYRIANSIPLLGKDLSPVLINKLLQHNSTVVIVLDPDAQQDLVDLYNNLASLGIDVYIIPLNPSSGVNLDISEIYQTNGRKGIAELLRGPMKINFDYEITRKLNE